MSDEIQSPAGAPAAAAQPSMADRLANAAKHVTTLFTDGRQLEAPQVAAAPGPAPAEPAPAVPEPEPKAEDAQRQEELSALIRERRTAREASRVAQTEAGSLKERLAAAEARLARLDKTDIVADPVGFAEALGLEPAEIAALGQTLLYHLVPDKADAETRIKLMEAQRARRDKLAEQRATKAEQEARERAARETYEDFQDAVMTAATKVTPGAFPASEDWFGSDRETYARSLIATANNLAEAARAKNEVADLSFGAVAKVLEADLEVRFQRRASRGGRPQAQDAKQTPATPAPAKQGGGDQTISTRGLTGGGAPRSPAKTEAERLARAAEVVFRAR